jgi:hypothetical protein
MNHLLLDESGTNPVSGDYALATDEVGFLRCILAAERLQVRGERLCAWAAAFADARGWPYVRLQSPATELQTACPELSTAEAQAWIEAIRPRLGDLPRPLRLTGVLIERWPTIRLWEQQPGTLHSFHWLEWLAQATLTPAEVVLVRALARRWAEERPELARAYGADSPAQAWECLLEWLQAAPTTTEWPLLPLDTVPAWLSQRLRDHWAVASITHPAPFFDDLLHLGAHRDALRVAADLVASYLRQHPQALTRDQLSTLIPYLSFHATNELRMLVAPDDPGEVPEALDALVEWFVERYLPFREWEAQRGTADDRRRVAALARDFGERYLDLYSQACVGGRGAEWLSWRRVANLAPAGGDLTLLVVLDGLGYRDAQQLWEFIAQSSRRLALDALDIALAPLPTVTDFAKQALQGGLPPGLAIEAETPNRVERRDEAVIAALSADEPSPLVIWSLLEPDRTYHKHQSRETTFSQVRGQLASLAERIVRVAHMVPEERSLRIIVATDHGRLLGTAERCVSIPVGMQAHGRAAWGDVAKDFGEAGFLIEDDIAYLSRQRFNLPTTVAILLSGAAFLTASGATGVEPFPHGGAYPEETLIPWLVLSRDRRMLPLAANLSGKAVGGTTGQALLTVVNPNEVAIRLHAIELSSPSLRLELEHQRVGAKSHAVVSLFIAPWPEVKEAAEAQGRLCYTLPSGEIGEVALQITLESEEMYSSDDILSDLGDL